MAKFRSKFLYVIAFSVFSLLILGCGPDNPKPAPDVAEKIKLNSGAVLKSENGEYNLYDYNDTYIKYEPNKFVLTYDESSSNYLYRYNDDTFAVYDNKEIKINDSEYVKLKLSPGGGYLSYFIEDNGMKLKIVRLKDNKEVEIQSDVSISGTLYDWYDDKSIVYYGVSDDGINGIFINNIEDNKEELIYKIKEGYIAYIKGTDDNVLFLQLDFNNERQLIMLDKKTKNIEVLDDSIEEIKDAVRVDGNVFFIGRVKDNANSLYKISDGTTKRVVYDFPLKINTEKGIRSDKNGNILFIGTNEPNGNKEQVFKYSSDGSVSSISDLSSDYAFVQLN